MMSSSGASLSACAAPAQARRSACRGRSGLRLGGAGQEQLVALRGDVVDLDLDLFLVAPTRCTAWSRRCWRPAPNGPRTRRQLPAANAPWTKGALRAVAAAAAAVPEPVRRVSDVAIFPVSPVPGTLRSQPAKMAMIGRILLSAAREKAPEVLFNAPLPHRGRRWPRRGGRGLAPEHPHSPSPARGLGLPSPALRERMILQSSTACEKYSAA